MKNIFKAVLKLWIYFIYSFFKWIKPFSDHPEKHDIKVRYARVSKFIKVVLKNLNVKVEVLGKENIQSGSACYFGNHLSAFDPLLYFDAFDEPIIFVAKKEIENLPFVGRIFKADDGLFLDRNNLKQELKIMMKVEDGLRNNHGNYFIFPEGTRNKDPMALLLPFHKGTFRAAMKAGVPIVPVVNYGSFRVLSKKEKGRTYPTTIKFLKPIMPEDYMGKTTDEIAAIVQSEIQKELAFNVRKIDNQKMTAIKDKKYRYNQTY